MSGIIDREPRLQRIMVRSLGAIVLVTVLVVAIARIGGFEPLRPADSPTTASIELFFTDRADGSIDVSDARTGKVIKRVEPGTNGFLRSTLRGLARERKRQSAGPEVPFSLVAHQDGRLTLMDPATQRRVDLEAFGPANSGVFLQFLSPAQQKLSLQSAAPMPDRGTQP